MPVIVPPELHFVTDARLIVEADLLPDGSFGREWLVITADRLLVYSENGHGAGPRLDLPLTELTEPKAEAVVGGGAVEVRHAETRHELIRFTASRQPRFSAAVQVLEKWTKGEAAEVPEEEQRRCPTCGFPLEAGTTVCPACLPRSRTLRRVVAYLGPVRVGAIGLMLLACFNTGLGLIQPYLSKPLYDKVLAPTSPTTAEQRLHLLGLLALTLLGIHVVRAVTGVLQSWLSAWLGNNVIHDIRTQLYAHLQYLSLRFFDKRQMGSVISRVNQDAGQLHQFLVWGVQDLVINLLQVVGIGTVLFLLDWRLALCILIPAPLIGLLAARFWRHIRQYMHRFFRRWGRVNAVLAETLNGLRIVRAFAQERREIDRFHRYSHELATSGVQVERFLSTMFSGFGLLITLATLLIWYIGGRHVLDNIMTLGEFAAFTMYVGLFFQPLQAMSMIFNWLSRAMTAAERIFEVLDSEPEVVEADDAITLPHIAGEVEFRNITFGYEPHRPALKGISFTVQPGEMIGLVGHSGAGKSTTMNLVCRFYDPQQGDILIDGVPLRKLKVEDLRRQIGMVPQDTFLFSGTLAENIAYAKPAASRLEIIRAAKVANAHDFISKKPDGYETLIGEGGKGLSGGEMQRIAIARAVLHDPRILILDEATSHVDVETEKQIQEAIGRLVHGRTTFAIAHRLSTLKHANRLLVLKDGEIAEIGTHDELLAKEDGEFKRLVETYQEISKVQAVGR